MKFIDFFPVVVSRIDYQLKLFEAVDKKHFNEVILKGTWTPDAIFRHILWSMNSINSMCGFEKLELAIKQMPTGSVQNQYTSVNDVRADYNKIVEYQKKKFNDLTRENLNQEVKTFFGTVTTLEGQLISALLHIVEHVGDLRWQFKRMTGWDDKKVYSLMSTSKE